MIMNEKELKIVTFVDGEDEPRPVRDLWGEAPDGRIDPYIEERLSKIENGELNYQNLKEIYERFGEIEGVDAPFHLVSEDENSVTICWDEEDWIAKFVVC